MSNAIYIYPELGDIQGERIRKATKESFIGNGWDDPNADLAELADPPYARRVTLRLMTGLKLVRDSIQAGTHDQML